MSFSKTSEEIMKYFLNDFDKFSKKITSKDQERLDRIFKQFWWDIKILIQLLLLYVSGLLKEVVEQFHGLRDRMDLR